MEHGGARPGAGRKPTGRVRRTLWLTDLELEKIRALLIKWREKK